MSKLVNNDCYWADNDHPLKVFSDSLDAIERTKHTMTPEQLRNAVTQMKTGLAPDGASQLCDRKASGNFQG